MSTTITLTVTNIPEFQGMSSLEIAKHVARQYLNQESYGLVIHSKIVEYKHNVNVTLTLKE